MTALPLLRSGDDADILVWHRNEGVTRAGFTAAARQLATRLPAAPYAINLCASRLGFMLSFAAAALREQITLLPPNQTPAALQAVKQAYPAHVLDDECLSDLDWRARSPAPLALPAEQIVAILFTSGSTGAPQPQAKHWGTLARTGQLDAERFLHAPRMNLVATVPSQHMFGLQTTVLLPFASDAAIYDGRPFFPADIRAALAALPAPRALVTTPTHLRACLASELVLPPLEFVLSATAPMPLELAQQAEAHWRTQVLEIYGSTEAGTLGTRRSTEGDPWRSLPDTRLEPLVTGTRLHAAHLPALLLLSDHVELISATEFRLLGRAGDQVKIAGKRSSLGELTHALLGVPGVRDGVVFLPPGRERTAALVVAEGTSEAQILDALARQVDAVFLPRPLVVVERLPRNEVGKLTQAALLAALESDGAE